MTERWISNKKYFCEYCRIWIADNKIQRQHHESGLKHKDRVQAFLRDMHKRDEAKSKEQRDTLAILGHAEQMAASKVAREGGVLPPRWPGGISQIASKSYSVPEKRSITAPIQPKWESATIEKVSTLRVAASTEMGSWTAVEADKLSVPSVIDNDSQSATVLEQEIAEDEDGDQNLHEFKLVEKRLAIVLAEQESQDATPPTSFKKRKKK